MPTADPPGDDLRRLQARVYGPTPSTQDVEALAEALRTDGRTAGPVPAPPPPAHRRRLPRALPLVAGLAAIVIGIGALQVAHDRAEAERVAAAARAARAAAAAAVLAADGSHSPDWAYAREPRLLPAAWRSRPSPFSFTTLRGGRDLTVHRAGAATRLLLAVACPADAGRYRWRVSPIGRAGSGICGGIDLIEVCCIASTGLRLEIDVEGAGGYSVSTYQR